MLKLTLISTEPTWLDFLPGVRLRLKPPTVVVILSARDSAGAVYRANRDAEEADKDPHIAITATIEMVRAYARQRIDGWEGIGNEAGEPAGIVHRGEYVIDRASVDRIGIGTLDAMRKGARGYADGGYVRPTPVSRAAFGASASADAMPSVVINNNGAPVQVQSAQMVTDG